MGNGKKEAGTHTHTHTQLPVRSIYPSAAESHIFVVIVEVVVVVVIVVVVVVVGPSRCVVVVIGASRRWADAWLFRYATRTTRLHGITDAAEGNSSKLTSSVGMPSCLNFVSYTRIVSLYTFVQ